MLSHLLLRDNNDGYLRETKEMAKVGEGWSWLLLPGKFSLWKGKDTGRFWQGEVRGWDLINILPH